MTRVISEFVQYAAPVTGHKDGHGNETPGWAEPVDVGVYAFDPGSTSEPREPGADRVIVEPTLFLPSDSVFDPLGLVTVRGVLYGVEGITRQWVHPTGRQRGNVVSLRRVEG